MTQYRIFHPQSSKFVVPNSELPVDIEFFTSIRNVEGTGTAPSFVRELIFSESDGEDVDSSYFELIPAKRKGKGKGKGWCHIKHVKSGMYVTRFRAPSSSHITLWLSDREPKSANRDLFRYVYQDEHLRIKCKTSRFSPRRLFWYGYNPTPDTLVYVVNRHRCPSHPAAFNFMLKEV